MKTTNFIKSLFIISLLSIGINFVLTPMPVRASEKTSLSKNIDSGDEKFDRTFREARELMDKEEWAKAVAKFNEIVCDCPDKPYVDAAFYWLAYCYKKQKMTKETNEVIERLLKNFPNSSWSDDARVLRYQTYTIAQRPAIRAVGSGQNVFGTSSRAVYAEDVAKLETELTLSGNYYAISQQNPLDREDEIKLAAFQSLMAADPKRGIEALGEMFKSNSKASETLKREVLRTLRGSRFYALRSFSANPFPETTPTNVVTQINPLLRETLVKIYQGETNAKIRTEILYSIANINDETSINYLAQLYSTESDKELKKVIINALGVGTYTVFGAGNAPVAVAGKLDAERALVTTGVSIASVNTFSNTSPIRKLRFDKLMEIFRIEKDLELRRLAFNNVQRFAGWSNSEGMVDMLAQMYDSEADEQFKISIISSFSGLNKNSQATNKLLNIAKNDKSDKLRLEAIRALRNSSNPEVLRFLEDLIK